MTFIRLRFLVLTSQVTLFITLKQLLLIVTFIGQTVHRQCMLLSLKRQNNCSRPRPSEANKQDSSPTFATLGTHPTASDPSQLNIQNTNNAACTSRPHGTSEHGAHSRNRNVKLPAFTGNCNDSWKVWYSRFTTDANLNNWDHNFALELET